MAQILSFRTPESRDSGEMGRLDGRSAEVIPFPGVRYERWGAGEASQGREERRAERDVMELADQ